MDPHKGGSPLTIGLRRGLEALGHVVQDYHPEGEYDLLLVCNQVAHRLDYAYPDYPLRTCPIAFIDAAEYGYFRRLPGVIRDYANAFAPGSMTHDTKLHVQQLKLRRLLEGRSFPYFLREHSKYIEFPVCYHPIDYPLYLHSECHERPDREEYLRRPQDLFVSWGASHPWRWPITHALRAARPDQEILVLEEPRADGSLTPRMPQSEYFPKTRGAKCSVSFDGYGSGSFRRQEVLVRTVLLDGPLSIRTHAPLVDGLTCVGYEVYSEGEEFRGTNIVDKLEWLLAHPDRAFAIYAAGYDHCWANSSEKATAEYFLATVEAHDWGKVTPLDL